MAPDGSVTRPVRDAVWANEAVATIRDNQSDLTWTSKCRYCNTKFGLDYKQSQFAASRCAETPVRSYSSGKLQMAMRVKVLFFGMLRDIVGRVEESVELAPGARLSTVFDHYAGQFPRLREMAGSIV